MLSELAVPGAHQHIFWLDVQVYITPVVKVCWALGSLLGCPCKLPGAWLNSMTKVMYTSM